MDTLCERVLVVNSDPGFLKWIASVLASHGIDVATATTAQSVRSIIAAGFAPSVIILDLKIGGTKQGEDLVRDLREDARSKDIPLVAASATPDRLQALGRTGLIDATLAKPFSLADLDVVLHELCGDPPQPFPRLT